ncbi:FAD assembly factor SdhE [Alteraurantiacibacter palmitatis]|uniref:FAD assembly factor SdhE n=1 Tax=Alteraurantiacibacter palmitatis TaxID=2054628 RepID=A0ABV7E2W6_9SPHN
MQQPDLTTRLARLKFRAWHRGTREADYMVGGFFDRYHADWGEAEIAWFEALVDEEDVDILSWAFGTAPAPQRYHGPLLDAFQRIDYVNI